jgi:hypothetical protein
LADIEDTRYSAQVVRGTKRALILGITRTPTSARYQKEGKTNFLSQTASALVRAMVARSANPSGKAKGRRVFFAPTFSRRSTSPVPVHPWSPLAKRV